MQPTNEPIQYVRARPSAAATFFKCCTVVIVSALMCVTGVVMGTLGMAQGKVRTVLSMAGNALHDLPNFLEGLPPVVADAVYDAREPEYAGQVEIKGEIVRSPDRAARRAVIVIQNHGDKVVSMLAVRVVSLDADGRPIKERIVYGATPIAMEEGWRGLLFPGATRRLAVPCAESAQSIEVDLSELRVWEEEAPADEEDPGLARKASSSSSPLRSACSGA